MTAIDINEDIQPTLERFKPFHTPTFQVRITELRGMLEHTQRGPLCRNLRYRKVRMCHLYTGWHYEAIKSHF